MNEEFVDCRCRMCGKGIRVIIAVSKSKTALCKMCKEKYTFTIKPVVDVESQHTNRHGVIY